MNESAKDTIKGGNGDDRRTRLSVTGDVGDQ